MAGTLANARIWSLADFYIGETDAEAPTDTTAELGADWEPLGLIDDDGGIGKEFTSEDADHYAYGGILVRQTSVKQKLQMTATALENTDLVWHLANPGSESDTDGGLTTRTQRPRNLGMAIRSVVLEKKDGDITSRLYLPRVQITASGSSQTSDAEIEGTPLTLAVLGANDEGGEIFLSVEITDDPGAAVSGS